MSLTISSIFWAAGILSLAVNARTLGRYARIVQPEIVSNTTYDFIVVGGGIAGLTVADRLTEDPRTTVLVVEFGPLDRGEEGVLVPGQYFPVPYFYPNIFSTPQSGLNNGTFFVPMGGVVGGGSTINAMFFLRCAAEDYNSWEALGNKGWGWDSLLPYFKKSETFNRPENTFAKEHNISWDDSVHGFNGPVQASYSPYDYPSSKNFWDASLSIGIPESKDPNDGDATGLFWLLRALDPITKTRSYARTVHYDQVIKTRPNYHLLPEHVVGKVLFKEKKAIGIEYVSRASGETKNATAKKEVIIAAGAVHSPQVLQLSGVGPKPLLESFGIKMVVDLPGVGSNFQDHLGLKVDYDFTSNPFPNAGSLNTNATYDLEQHILYNNTRQGAYTLIRGTGNNIISLALPNTTSHSNVNSILSIFKSQNPASLLPPTVDPTVLAGYTAQRALISAQLRGTSNPIGTISWNTGPETTIYMIKPASRGSITLASIDPLSNPLIDFNSVRDPTDLELVLALFKKNREIMAQPAMQELGPTETVPGEKLVGDGELKAAFRGLLQPSNAHQCCTLPMMKRSLGGVVDEKLLVHGTKGLRVVDASFWPITPGGAPSATVYAGAEKAADMIKKAWGLPPFDYL